MSGQRSNRQEAKSAGAGSAKQGGRLKKETNQRWKKSD